MIAMIVEMFAWLVEIITDGIGFRRPSKRGAPQDGEAP